MSTCANLEVEWAIHSSANKKNCEKVDDEGIYVLRIRKAL